MSSLSTFLFFLLNFDITFLIIKYHFKQYFMIYIVFVCSRATGKEFPHWEATKKDPTKAAKLHVFAMANIVQRPIIVYAKPGSNIG